MALAFVDVTVIDATGVPPQPKKINTGVVNGRLFDQAMLDNLLMQAEVV